MRLSTFKELDYLRFFGEEELSFNGEKEQKIYIENTEMDTIIEELSNKDIRFERISNTRFAYVLKYRVESERKRAKPITHYSLILRNIKSFSKEKNKVRYGNSECYGVFVKFEELRIEFNPRWNCEDTIDRIFERLLEDKTIRKYIADDKDTLYSRIENFDYDTIYEFYHNEENKEYLDLLKKYERTDITFYENEEEYNRANEFKIFDGGSFIRIIKNDKFVPREWNNNGNLTWNDMAAGIRDWSDKTDGYY